MIEIVRVKRECAKQLASELVGLLLASRLGFLNLLSQTQKYNRFSNNGILCLKWRHWFLEKVAMRPSDFRFTILHGRQ